MPATPGSRRSSTRRTAACSLRTLVAGSSSGSAASASRSGASCPVRCSASRCRRTAGTWRPPTTTAPSTSSASPRRRSEQRSPGGKRQVAGESPEIGPVAVLVALVVEQVVQLLPRQHSRQEVALGAVGEKSRQRLLGGKQGGAERGHRVEDQRIPHRRQGRRVQVGALAELGHVGQQRHAGEVAGEGGELLRRFERL